MAELEQSLEDEVHVLRPKGEHRTWTFEMDGETRQYVQRPMSYFQKLELFAVLGNALERVSSSGVNIGEALGGGGNRPSISSDGQVTFGKADDTAFFSLIAKVAAYAPELIMDLYSVILNVPEGEREWASAAMSRSEAEGGLSDEDGFGIIELFIDQNGEAMRSFFAERVKGLIDKAKATMGSQEEKSESSKPSKATPRSTRKA